MKAKNEKKALELIDNYEVDTDDSNFTAKQSEREEITFEEDD